MHVRWHKLCSEKRAKGPGTKINVQSCLEVSGCAEIDAKCDRSLSHRASAKHCKPDFRHGREAVTLALQKCRSSDACCGRIAVTVCRRSF